MKTPSRFIYAYPIVGGVLVLGALAAGLWLNYGPAARDARISQMLEAANNFVNYYQSRTNTLPETLKQAATADAYYQQNFTISDVLARVDYVKTSSTAYQLCAEFEHNTFDRGQDPSYAFPNNYSFDLHDAGRYCFTREVYPNPR